MMTAELDRRRFLQLSPAFPAATVTGSLTLRKDGEPPITDLDLSVLRLQRGDVLVVTTPGQITAEYGNRLSARLNEFLEQFGATALVFSDGVTVAGVLRP